jgi:flavin reductase (DIM6/NTAB) family NADH-FMN oxidoreductase RutF
MSTTTLDAVTAPDPDAFRTALRNLVGQVSVITLIGADGAAAGLTLTSASALTTTPPLMIACVNRTASAHGSLRLGAVIGWQVLGAHQQQVAERFSGKDGAQGAARFAGADWHEELGAHLLEGAAMACAAQIESLSDHASHTVVVARILSLRARTDTGTLAYRDGAYLPLA